MSIENIKLEDSATMEVGAIVKPKSGWLRSGASAYQFAIVIQVEPNLVLVSEHADMRWGCSYDVDDVDVIGKATPEALAKCMHRLEG